MRIDLPYKENVKAELKEIYAELERHHKKIIEISNTQIELFGKSSSKNISAFNEDAKKLTDTNKRLTETVAAQTKEIDRLREAKIKVNQKTSEEIVNQRILAKNANTLATANSALAGAYNRLNAQRTIAANKLRDLIASEKASNEQIKQAQREFDVLDNKVQKANNAIGNFSKSTQTAKTVMMGMGQLMGAFGIATGLYLGASIVKNIYETTKELQSLNLALKMVSGTQQEYKANQSFIASTANQWGLEIKSLTEQYTKFYTASKGIISDQQIKSTFESIAKSGAVMGLSVDKQRDALLALEQMMSKGKVTAEELRKQLGNAMPGAIRAAAMAYMDLHPQITNIQKAEAALLAEMKKGAIDSAVYVPLIAKNFEKLYGIETLNGIDTLISKQNKLQNSWTEMVAAMDASNSLTVAGQTLSGMTILAEGLLDKLTKILSTQKQINDRTITANLNSGSDGFYSDLKDFGGTTKESQIAYAKKMLHDDVEEYNYLVKRYNELNKELAESSVPAWEVTLKSNIESTSKAMGYFLGRIQEAKFLLGPKNKPLTGDEDEVELEKKRKERLKKELDDIKQSYDNKILYAKLELQVIDQTLNDEERYYSDRLSALDLDRKKRAEIISLGYERDLALLYSNFKNKEITEKEYYRKSKTLLMQYQLDITDLIEDNVKKREKLESLELQPADLQKTNFAELGLKEVKKDAEETTKAFEKLQDQIKKVQEQLEKMTFDFINSFSDNFMADMGLGSLKMFLDGTFDQLYKGADSALEKFQVTFLAISEAAQEMFNYMTEASAENFEAQYADAERQYEVSKAFAGDSIEAQKKVEKEYEDKKRAIKNKEAKAAKELALFNIFINTAQAVVAALPNIGLSLAIGALGTLEYAMVASKDVPKYFKGTDYHKGGLMLVNDGGGSDYQETIITPKGDIIQPTGKNVLLDAPKGTKVRTNKQWKDELDEMLQDVGIDYAKNISTASNIVKLPIGNSIDKSDFKSLEQTIKNKKEVQWFGDKRGIRQYITEGNTRKEILDNEVNSRGINT